MKKLLMLSLFVATICGALVFPVKETIIDVDYLIKVVDNPGKLILVFGLMSLVLMIISNILLKKYILVSAFSAVSSFFSVVILVSKLSGVTGNTSLASSTFFAVSITGLLAIFTAIVVLMFSVYSLMISFSLYGKKAYIVFSAMYYVFLVAHVTLLLI